VGAPINTTFESHSHYNAGYPSHLDQRNTVQTNDPQLKLKDIIDTHRKSSPSRLTGRKLRYLGKPAEQQNNGRNGPLTSFADIASSALNEFQNVMVPP
jgi:hypothetical protein